MAAVMWDTVLLHTKTAPAYGALCFLCTKESSDLESIIVKSPIVEQNNRTLIINNNNNYKDIFCFIIILFGILALIFINIKVF